MPDKQHRRETAAEWVIMEIEKLAPHIEEISRALGGKLADEQIAEELQKYVDVYKLSIPVAKRTIVKKHGGDTSGFSAGFQRKLAELRPSDPNADFVAKILSANTKEITVKGEKKSIIYGFLGDETTTLPYTAWEIEDLTLQRGEVISVRGAYTKEYQGRVQVNFGNRVSIKKEDPSVIGDIQIAQGPPKIVTVSQLRESMGFVEIKGRILSVETREVIVQGQPKNVWSGIIADETGKAQFSAWSDFKLKPGDVVRISKATVKAWRGIPQLTFDDRADLTKVMEDFPSAEELQQTGISMVSEIAARGGASDVTIRGVLVEIREGSGLIMRCPECKRALQKGTCKIHGRVEGFPDLRIKAMLDDGSGAVGVVMNRELTEKLMNITLDESMQKAKESMNFDIVKDAMDDSLTLKLVSASGSITADQYGLSMIVKDAQMAKMDVKEEAERVLVELEAQE